MPEAMEMSHQPRAGIPGATLCPEDIGWILGCLPLAQGAPMGADMGEGIYLTLPSGSSS